MKRQRVRWSALAAPLLFGTILPFAVFLSGVTVALATPLPAGSDVYAMGVVATCLGMIAWSKYRNAGRLLLFTAGGLLLSIILLIEGWRAPNSSVADMVPGARDCAYPLVTALVFGGIALSVVRRTRRFFQAETPPGHCPHCNYSLTGNTTGTCPECGRPAEVP